MKVQAPFGFVTGCHAGDKFLVQATLASMRHYCPNVPICLTVDGDCDVSDLEKEYGVIVLRISDLPLPEMRTTLGRSFHAKQAAMWEGPFEFYVWMDSDAIVWGDFTSQIRTDLDFQILWDGISIPPDADTAIVPDWLPHYYFEPREILRHDPDFDWRGHAYFSAGVYAARRNAIAYDHYCEIKRIADDEPGTFAWGDMGMLNYLVHSQAQRGKISIAVTDLQNIPTYNGWGELEQDCLGCGWRFPDKINRPRVAHFCGRKPFLFDRKASSRAFAIARLEHQRLHHSELGARLAVLNEDRRVLLEKVKSRLKQCMAKCF